MDKASQDLRIIVFKEGDAWIAQCLEFDICAQANDLEELRARIEATIEAEHEHSVRAGKKPFAGIDPAPEHYHNMWTRRSPFATSSAVDSRRVELALCA